MTDNVQAIHSKPQAHFKDYLQLCKPRVVALMMLTAVVGMLLAPTHHLSWQIFIFANLGIALVASAAAAINHVVEHRIDILMKRTQRRPIVQGKISPGQALWFAFILCCLGSFLLVYFVNMLVACLTLMTLVGYAGIYTLYLKHATPQNIVIGGLAGAAPPLLGWVAVTGHIDPASLLLTLIIFVWTPPHFWALAIHRYDDYATANIPMLPITHGIRYTKINIVLYTFLLTAVTLLPFAINMSGWIYLIGVLILDARFLQWSFRLLRTDRREISLATFHYSIIYLMILFMIILIDHYLRPFTITYLFKYF